MSVLARPSEALASLTGLRGIAAWWVVLYHFRIEAGLDHNPMIGPLLAQGYLAVDLFFILSGFVIALRYTQSFTSITKRGVVRFLGYRLSRIYPLHFVVLVLYGSVPLLYAVTGRPVPAGRYDLQYLVESLLLVQNWGLRNVVAWNFPAWSISTEWAAYLLFPTASLVACRLPAMARFLVILAALVLLGTIGHLAGGLGDNIPIIGLYRCLAEFAIGMALHGLWANRVLPRGPWAVLAFAGSLATWATFRAPDYLLAPVTLTLLVWTLLDQQTVVARLLSHRAVLALGEVSYSTYLVHYLVKDWLKLGLSADTPPLLEVIAFVGLVFLASLLLFRFVEQPGRRLGREWTDWLVSSSVRDVRP